MERIITTEAFEHGQVPDDGVGHPYVLDAVEVYDARKFQIVFVRGREDRGNISEHVGVAAERVVEARAVEPGKLSAPESARVPFGLASALVFTSDLGGCIDFQRGVICRKATYMTLGRDQR